MGWLALLLFFLLFLLIMRGFPVAIVLGGGSIVFALCVNVITPDLFRLGDFWMLAPRYLGTMNNTMLMAVPLFIFMGIMLEKSGLAENMLINLALFFGKERGGLGIAVVLVGAMLAASTGIVGATVISMGSIALPVMIKNGYKESFACGIIAASGTLGQIIPPSIVLILLADQIGSNTKGVSQVDVGGLFQAAMIPGFLVVIFYLIYVLAFGRKFQNKPESESEIYTRPSRSAILKSILFPLGLIVLVLGTILLGIASPTEAASIGALGSIIIAIIERKLNFQTLQEVSVKTLQMTAMVFLILFGATTFTLVFRTLGGDAFLVDLIQQSQLSGELFLFLVMLVIFIAGFFIDFIEIIFIFIPVVTPIFGIYQIDLMWVAVLLALNLQTSFLTPPFGFSLFYLKGVAPPSVTTQHIYRGVIPFIFIQLFVIVMIIFYPEIIYFLK